MTENVCDSWEDVDVDNIVIKPNKAKINSTSKAQTNSSFHIEENAGNIVTNNTTTSTQFNPNAFKVLKRNSVGLLPTPTTIQPNTMLYSSIVTSQLSPNATPFEYHPKVVLEDSTRTQFVAPLRILNRPNSNKDQTKDSRSNVDVNKQLLKSFEEKQAEYAKARLRILGEEMPAENLDLEKITESVDKISMNQNPASNKSPLLPSPPKPVLPNGGNSERNHVIIIREPTVPDGTKGFNYVR